mmetsp:Transcript_134691/g.418605  ORF Transcript_134691/g.418605 Transcript_134691/m.418605 type:complete len:216 (-) Transcript_134691:31-678(-)
MQASSNVKYGPTGHRRPRPATWLPRRNSSGRGPSINAIQTDTNGTTYSTWLSRSMCTPPWGGPGGTKPPGWPPGTLKMMEEKARTALPFSAAAATAPKGPSLTKDLSTPLERQSMAGSSQEPQDFLKTAKTVLSFRAPGRATTPSRQRASDCSGPKGTCGSFFMKAGSQSGAGWAPSRSAFIGMLAVGLQRATATTSTNNTRGIANLDMWMECLR